MNEQEEVGIPVLVSNFMKEYEAKVEEVELPEANQYVDDVLLPKYTSDLSPELLDAFVDGVKGPINTLLQGHMHPPEEAVQEVSEHVESTETTVE